VEDESLLREVACEILESAGYRVLKAGTAAEAISAFDEYKTIVRLLLTDVVLPGQNGRDLATDLRYVCPKLRINSTRSSTRVRPVGMMMGMLGLHVRR
jgi:DNA-binding response OmpR family regulator